MNEIVFTGGYLIVFIIFMLPVEIRNQIKPLAKRYYFLAILLTALVYYLIVAFFSQQWAKPFLWILSPVLYVSGLLFTDEIVNGIVSFWRRLRGK